MVSKNYLNDGEYDMPIFCSKHRIVGSLAFREGGKDKLMTIMNEKRGKKKAPLSAE